MATPGLTSEGLLRGAIAAQWGRCSRACAGVPVVIGIVIDRAVATGEGGSLAWGIAGLALLFVGLSGLYLTAVYAYFRGELNAGHEVRMAVTRRILDPRGGADAVLPGALLSTATGDARRIAEVTQTVVSGAAALRRPPSRRWCCCASRLG
ncbi:MAG: hypothetical protein ACRD0K_22965 [Egibacteraceae bacterium]